MTKEQFIDKWMFGSNPLFEADLNTVIATEIAKAQEGKPQTSSQGKLDNSFDKDRFERMFCIFALRGDYLNFEQIKNSTEQALAQLDAYYASKEGGNNG